MIFSLLLVGACKTSTSWQVRMMILTKSVRLKCPTNRTQSELTANHPRHRIAARLRFCLKLNGSVWAARGALGR
jgi:hypothetical protein